MFIRGVSEMKANPFLIQFHGGCAQTVPTKIRIFLFIDFVPAERALFFG
jgi:hypothetical protein